MPEEFAVQSGYARLDDVIALFRDYFEEIRALDPEVSKCLDVQNIDEELAHPERKYALPDGRLLLATMGSEAIGCCAIYRNDASHCELKRLYVSPAQRRRGVAQQLLEVAIAEARRIGYAYIRLDTFAFMTNAIQLYARNGFLEVPRYNNNPAPSAVYLQRAL